ncbi:hypothetical protein F4818DRAFT_439910 [Hypoxylon cercidicola]|nr:hypothetical protein F4818DRAFT_439910 [Hypoxylon cercidicola]
MNLFRGRCRSKSIGSQPARRNRSGRRILHQEDDYSDDEFYIPGGKGLYVTRASNGKPALGRKKSNRLLEDYGFDLLGQSFGVPSRMDFERRPRRRSSFHSPPSARDSSTPCGRSSKYNTSSEHETPTGRKSRARSHSASTVGCQHHCHCDCTLHRDRCHYEGSKSRSSSLKPKKSSLSAKSSIPAPSPNQPPTWNFQPPSTPSTAANKIPPPMNLPTGLQGQAAQFSPFGNLPAWTPPQISPGMNSRFVASPVSPISPVFPGFRSASMPVFIQPQSPTPYPEARTPTHAIPGATIIPPPPPSFTPSHGPLGSPSPCRYSPNEVKKFEEHYKAQAREAEENKENKGKGNDNQNDDISKHIQHCHFCAACGTMRSKGYHKAHPLKRGQIPERSYCSRCIDATATNGSGHNATKGSARAGSGTHNHPQDASQGPPKTNTGYTSPGEKKGHTKNSRSRGWVKKARRISLLSNLLASPTASVDFSQRTETVASDGESEYIPSAPIPISKAAKDRAERSASSGKRPAPNVAANVSPVAVDAPSHTRGGSPDKYQEPVREKIAQAKTSRSSDKPERQRPRVAKQEHEPSGPPSNSYDKIRIPSGTKMPEKRSKIPRPANAKMPSEVTSKGSSTNAPEPSEAARMYHESQYNDLGPSEAARMYHQSQYKAPVVIDEEDENVEFPAETPGRFETTSSNLWGKSHREQSSDQKDQYKSSRKDKHKHKNRGNHEQWRKPSPVIPRTAGSQQAPEFGQQEWTGPRQTGQHRDDAGAGAQGDGEARIRFADEVLWGSPNEPDHGGWNWPPTSTDPLYTNMGPVPEFTDDFWGINQGTGDRVKQEADVFAEPDPAASASKFFENLTNSGTGFSRLVPSFLTRSEISVESYGSNGGGPGGEGSDPSATYKLDDASETGGETVQDEDYRSVKKLEYSSKDDHDQKTAARTRTHHRNRTSSTHDRRSQEHSQGNRSRSRSQKGEPSSKKSREKKKMRSSTRGSGSSLSLSPPSVDSSTLAHTGHSMENLPRDATDNNPPTEAGRRRRVRRPSRK